MHEEVRNRDWVKNAAIIFLVVILVLTFFSNTIMNRSLPEVASQEVVSGSIIARVRGTGTVQANSNTQVKMDKTRVIRSVLVKVGQQVEVGDVLFTLGEGASEEIDAAEEKLQSLQASYNRTAATIPEFNYATDTRKIGILKEKLAERGYKYHYGVHGESKPSLNTLFSRWPIVRGEMMDKKTKFHVDLQKGDHRVRICCVHLDSYELNDSDYESFERLSHAKTDSSTHRLLKKFAETTRRHEQEWKEELLPLVQSSQVPIIIAGDFNNASDAELMAVLQAFQDDCISYAK